MKLSTLKNRRAIGPEIATMILVGVAMTIIVTVSYWMGGISSQHITFEKVEMGTHALVDMTYSVLLTASNPPDIYAMSLAVILDTGLIVWKKYKFISAHMPKSLRNLASRLIRPSSKRNAKINESSESTDRD
jgi:hypothetical protein